ncbi:MAG: MBOAT family protein [Kiritimatiellae bacterium]|nr:MBOAT family protein [Kiritimatiellia bacterium]
MLFNSFQFLVFLTAVFFVYFAIPQRWRWAMLLAASYYFYMCWRVEYIFLIIASTLVDYFSAIGIERSVSTRKRRLFLSFSLITNLGLLFLFKYYNFFSGSLQHVFQRANILIDMPIFDVLLPVGISFYTFQTLSYTFDVYLNKRGAEKHLGIFALYVAFFPQLVAGPIERSTHLMPQFRNPVKFDYSRVVSGMRLMLWGFVKKIVIADRLAWGVENAYLRPQYASGLELVISTTFFAFQIYCDFSAYSDIAIGVARIFGYDLMQNFRQPYLAGSVTEFWQRWHISLSTWFKDYVYIPLGGSRRDRLRNGFNLATVFVLSGLWHGANWTFLVWGALHAVYMLAERALQSACRGINIFSHNSVFERVFRFIRIVITFIMVWYAWIYFRASSLHDAWVISGKLVRGILPGKEFLFRGIQGMPVGTCSGFLLIAFILCADFLQSRIHVENALERCPVYVRWGIYYSGVFSILLFGVLENDQFIYFQF